MLHYVRLLLGLTLLALVAVPASAQNRRVSGTPPAAGRSASAAFDSLEQRLTMHVHALASDSMGGRRPPSDGNRMAAAYIAREFQAAGLQPVAGPDGYFVNFNYVSGVQPGPNSAVTLTRGGESIAIDFAKDGTPMPFSSSGGFGGRLVFLGYGISDSSADYDDYAGIDAKEAVAVIMRYSPDGSAPHGPFANAASWTAKVRTALRHGVSAIIFINPPGDDAELPSMTMQRGFSDVGIPIVFVRDAALASLRDPSGRTLADVRKKIDETVSPSSFVFDGWRAEVAADVTILAEDVANVAGILPGNDPGLRDEVIVVGAHFDHLGHGGEESLYRGAEVKIHYGADDNASGTAGMMELARHFARTRDNRRTLMFVAFNGEEQGLLGSAAFVRRFPEISKLQYAAMINLDMIGRLDSGKMVIEGTGTAADFEPMLNRLNPGLRVKFSKSGYGSSDHTSFYGKQVPVLAFFTGTHKDYHKPSDTPDKINVAGQATIVRFVGSVMRAIDSMDTRPVFTKSDPPAGSRTAMAFRVYVGTIPDYAYEGKGMRLNGVSSGAPAEKAGLREGDVIVKLGGMAVNNIYDYMDALAHFSPKQKVEAEIIRDTEVVTVEIEMGSR